MCKECDEKDKRIKELEAMMRRFAESFDEYEAKISRRRSNYSTVTEKRLRIVAKI
jgi:hypothetical protein